VVRFRGIVIGRSRIQDTACLSNIEVCKQSTVVLNLLWDSEIRVNLTLLFPIAEFESLLIND